MKTLVTLARFRLFIVAVLSVAMIVACGGGAVVQRAEPVVFVLAGQSNMVGHGRTADLSAEQSTLPPNIRFFLGAREALPAAGARFGPELTFARRLAEYSPDRDYVLVKYAIGGTSLLDWAPEWDATRAKLTGNPERGPLYQQLIGIIEELSLKNAEFGGVLWMQGERDARIEAAGKDYYRNLENLIVALRRDLGREDLPFVLGMVNPPPERYPAREVVRDAQRQIAADMPGVYLVETDDLTKWDDRLHYDTAGLLELGGRYAAAVIATLE